MKMDGVPKRNRTLDDDVDPFTELDRNSKVARVGGDSVVVDDAVQSGVTPVGLEGGSIQVPSVQVDRVRVGDNNIVLNGFGRRADRLLDNRHQAGKRLVFTVTKDTACTIVLARVSPSSRGRGTTGAACVVDDTSNVIRVDSRSTGVLVVESQEVVANSLVGLNDNLVTLTNVDVQSGGLIRYNRDEIGGNDCELVSINVELVGRLNGAVQKLEQVLLAGNEFGGNGVASSSDVVLRVGINVLAVDEPSIHGTDTCHLSIVVHIVDRNMGPILDEEVTSVHVIFSGHGAFNVEGTKETLVSLEG